MPLHHDYDVCSIGCITTDDVVVVGMLLLWLFFKGKTSDLDLVAGSSSQQSTNS